MATMEPDELEYEALAAFEEEAAELLLRLEVALNELVNADEVGREKLLRDILRYLHTLKGAASVVGRSDVRRYVHSLEEWVRAIEQNAEPASVETIGELSAALGDIRAATQARPRPSAPSSSEETALALPGLAPRVGAAGPEVVRVRQEKIDALHAHASDLSIARLQYDVLARRMLPLRDASSDAAGDVRSLEAFSAGLRGALPKRTHAELTSRVRALSDSMSVVAKDMNAVTKELGQLEAQTQAVCASIEDGIRELRLVRLSSFFEELTRVVLETAREVGKEARLVISAGDAEIDRAVVTRLRDGLAHLVRNAVCHGIEAPDERVAKGKPRVGLVRLEGHCARSRAVVRVIDDGAGVDRDVVRRKAVLRGLARENDVLSDEALLALLTHPGFSTEEEVGALSGRGIGLDVVAAVVRSLDGHLELATQPDSGTTFTLEVPVTASTGLGLVVRAGAYAFGILLAHVERAIRVGPEDIRRLGEEDTVTIEDAPVAVVTLAALVGLPDTGLGKGDKSPAVVLRSGKQRLVILVDDVPADQSLVVKPLGRAFANALHLSGAAVLPDGSTLPVLHVPALLARAASRGARRVEMTRPAAKSTPAMPPEACAVLVVDDSMTMRTLLRNILRADGYEVVLAHDGKAALEVFDAMPRCDLVITDLEMPRMNGVELCKAIRRSPRAHVPVMVVTSVGDASEKRRALESGADAYVVKSDFQQARFLEAVSRLGGMAKGKSRGDGWQP